MEPDWTVYMIEAENGHLYTGITKNLERRFSDHKAGKKGAKFFRVSAPKKIVYQKQGLTRSEASKLEADLKKLSRTQKLELIQGRGESV